MVDLTLDNVVSIARTHAHARARTQNPRNLTPDIVRKELDYWLELANQTLDFISFLQDTDPYNPYIAELISFSETCSYKSNYLNFLLARDNK